MTTPCLTVTRPVMQVGASVRGFPNLPPHVCSRECDRHRRNPSPAAMMDSRARDVGAFVHVTHFVHRTAMNSHANLKPRPLLAPQISSAHCAELPDCGENQAMPSPVGARARWLYPPRGTARYCASICLPAQDCLLVVQQL